ncbi:MAG: hypothetical protein QOI93_81 [Rhodospirillaceae bacterium]|nr:hypothetical protein [Rhodospirillaceae bacterium]
MSTSFSRLMRVISTSAWLAPSTPMLTLPGRFFASSTASAKVL